MVDINKQRARQQQFEYKILSRLQKHLIQHTDTTQKISQRNQQNNGQNGVYGSPQNFNQHK